MSDYDFSSLNDKEFENLSIDLLARHLNSRVERFKSGKDRGVDGRFYSSNGDEAIIQCKHWIKSGLAALLRSLKKTEADKVKALKPKRYIFVTSLELSRANKIEIRKLLSPYVLRESDIFGNEDLNDTLSRYPEVEKKYYKLWISSTNVLQTMLNAAIVGRSKHKLEEIVGDSNRYVVTQSHDQAMVKLEKSHSIIITGAPGVGKTTLADQLCQFYSAKGYEFCVIESSLTEAEQIYREDSSQQVFYFDDFLGRNFLLALNSHQDSQVINFIKRIERDKKKRFILTSRSNVLNQGKRLSDLFEIKKIDRNEYELSISLLTDIDKAKILYNHIWFSDLADEYVDEIYKNKKYLKIINHKNFNPRLISFITDSDRLSATQPEGYWQYIENTLSNPKDIWRSVFEAQADDICRHIVIAVSLHGTSLREDSLERLFSEISSSTLTSNSTSSYDSVLRMLVGALLNRSIFNTNEASYNIFDPSIADFVISNYLNDTNYIDALLICLKTPHSISNLAGLMKSGAVSEKKYFKLIRSQLIKISAVIDNEENYSYALRLLACASRSSIVIDEKLRECIEIIAQSALPYGPRSYDVDYYSFIEWAYSLGYISAIDPTFKQRLTNWVFENEYDVEVFIPMSKLVVAIDDPPSDLTAEIKENYISYLSEEITNDVIEYDIYDDVYDTDDYNESKITSYVNDRFSELAIAFEQHDVEYVSGKCNVQEVIDSNIEKSMNDDHQYEVYREGRYNMAHEAAIIDDLFDRS